MGITRVGFIGLGIMGKPMALNLLEAGFALTVYSRSRAPVDSLVARGATAAPSPRAVAEASELVVTMVTDSQAVEDVVLGTRGIAEGAHAGLIVADMSTISPSTTRRVAAALAARGVSMLDAPVSGGETGAREGTLTIMVGGDARSFEASLPVFKAMGRKVVHMGATGSGQLAKLANQILVACNMAGVCECLNFAARAGLDAEKLIDSLSAGAASSWSLTNLGPKVARRDFAPGFKIKLLQKDLGYVLSSAEEVDAGLPATSLVHGLYGRLVEEGLGELGTQALVQAVEALSRGRDGQGGPRRAAPRE